MSDCNFCSAHGRVHADTQVAVVGSFRLHVMPRHVFETKRNLGNETSETPVFPNVSFAACDFLVNAGYVMQKPFRNRSCLGTEAV